MDRITAIADEIIAREGGYVDDPDDPGGETKFGITIGTLRRLGIDLDRNGDIDKRDVLRLTRSQARDIILKNYFEGPGIDGLPKPLQASVFDMYVNAGANAVRILQRLLNDMGQPVQVDGVIGPATRKAANAAMKLAPDHLEDAYGIARRNYYYRLADYRPASRKYARRRDGGKGGWILRAEEFISPKYHLSLSEHAARVASWG